MDVDTDAILYCFRAKFAVSRTAIASDGFLASQRSIRYNHWLPDKRLSVCVCLSVRVRLHGRGIGLCMTDDNGDVHDDDDQDM